ncbi:MAG: CPBP family glutamic-type intramembrane protease [Gemmatimonadales bacterium]
MSPREYWKSSRQPRYSVLFALPLWLLYEALAAAISGSAFAGVRNGADVLLKTLFVALGGRTGVFAFGLLLFFLGVWIVWRDRRKHPGKLKPRMFAWMFGESIVYAMLLGGVVSALTALLLSGPLYTVQVAQPAVAREIALSTQLVISLGAGLYEELLFRVLLVWALMTVGLRLGWSRSAAIGVSVVGSALIFSGFHYIGPLGDQLTLPSFTYRAVAGLLLSGLYVARGFGIVAWTHALYDVWVTLLGSA